MMILTADAVVILAVVGLRGATSEIVSERAGPDFNVNHAGPATHRIRSVVPP